MRTTSIQYPSGSKMNARNFSFPSDRRFLNCTPSLSKRVQAAQLYYALVTWDLVGHLEVTKVDLKFWRQFDPKVKIGVYKKVSKTYKKLTDAVHDWANKIVPQLADNTPKDYVLVECIDKEKGGPYGPRGMIRSLAAALGVYDPYNEIVPPNWGHPIPKNLDGEEDLFTYSDEVIEWGADHDDEYCGLDPALYLQRPGLTPRLEDMARFHYVY